MNRRAALALTVLLGACGDFPRTIALDHRVEPSCAVTLSSGGTSTTARAEETVTIETDETRATATLTSTCTLEGASDPVTCELSFGPDGTETIRIDEGSTATDLTVECPAERWTDAVPLD